ncbi:MAG: nickel-dependent hydrogenase large subunit, partial [Candidatus Bathyarchaeia archaeon]
MSVKEIFVDYIARVEGQGQIRVRIVDGSVETSEFAIFEPPKFFEAFLIGRKFDEVHELTSRICGICPAPHQIAALRAVENAIGVEVSEQTETLRRLLNYGSHIQSHVLNLYILAAPDYLGYESIIPLARQNPQVVKRALKLKKLGNDLEEMIGARAVHQTSAIVGGFTTIPSKAQMEEMKKRLIDSKPDAVETLRFIAGLEIPDFRRKCEHVALASDYTYPLNSGRLSSTEGLSIEESRYREYVKESQVGYSWAKHSTIVDRGSFLVGPLARVNINHKRLSDTARGLLDEVGFKPVVYNPFMHLVARAVEVVN